MFSGETKSTATFVHDWRKHVHIISHKSFICMLFKILSKKICNNNHSLVSLP